jgi:hypothetical protein
MQRWSDRISVTRNICIDVVFFSISDGIVMTDTIRIRLDLCIQYALIRIQRQFTSISVFFRYLFPILILKKTMMILAKSICTRCVYIPNRIFHKNKTHTCKYIQVGHVRDEFYM